MHRERRLRWTDASGRSRRSRVPPRRRRDLVRPAASVAGRPGGYWARWAASPRRGLALGVAQLHGRDGIGVRAFLLAFVPVLVAVGWVVLSAQPEPALDARPRRRLERRCRPRRRRARPGASTSPAWRSGSGSSVGLTFDGSDGAAAAAIRPPIAVPPTARDEPTVVTAPAGRDPARCRRQLAGRRGSVTGAWQANRSQT